MADHRGVAGRRAQQPHEQAQGRRLARAIRSEKAVDFPAPDREVQVFDSQDAGAIAFRQAVGLDDGFDDAPFLCESVTVLPGFRLLQ